MNIGVIALQGDFSNHCHAISRLGHRAFLIKKASELPAVDGLILPGGESTAILRLSTPEFREALCQKILSGAPTLATCAGVILLAKQVTNPAQESLGLLDISVVRNGYGRQVDSFIVDALAAKVGPIEAVFIRAPRITRTGAEVSVLARHNSEPVLVSERNIVGATFHPELSERADVVMELAFGVVRERACVGKMQELILAEA